MLSWCKICVLSKQQQKPVTDTKQQQPQQQQVTRRAVPAISILRTQQPKAAEQTTFTGFRVSINVGHYNIFTDCYDFF